MKVRYSFSSHRTRNIENIRKQRPKYPDLAKEVVEESDIILEILDARFVNETRNKELEEQIKKLSKKIIFVLNKSDLIDSQKIDKDLLKQIIPYIFVSSKERKGIKELRKRIQIESKKIPVKKFTDKQKKEQEIKGIDMRIKVGVIGYPNTGKSSLINVLVGKSSAGVGSDAGFTRGLQKIKLSSNIVLIDSPGVIPGDKYSQTRNEMITKNTKLGGKSYSQVREPENVVGLILKDHPNLLEKFYDIDADGDSDILLEELGKKKGFLKKGGDPNTDMAARFILKDWQSGKIRM